MNRAEPRICSNFEEQRCRSCTLLSEGTYAAAADRKEQILHSRAEQAGITAPILPLFRPQTIFPSRAKAKLAVAGTLDAPIFGLIDSALNARDLPDCPLHFPLINDLLRLIRARLAGYKLVPYDVRSRRGELKGVILVANAAQSEALVRFVLRSTEALPRVRKLAAELCALRPELKTVSVNIQPLPAAIPEGPEEILLSAQGAITENYGCCTILIQPQSFVQVTPESAAALYTHAAAVAARVGAKKVLDLFCGAGAFLLACAPGIEAGRGYEISEAAAEGAQAAAGQAGHAQLQFSARDIETQGVPEDFDPDFVIVNPPRRGLTARVRGLLGGLPARHVLYSSCNPESLFRDLGELSSDFKVIELAPFDMFPFTEHLETAALLARKETGA